MTMKAPFVFALFLAFSVTAGAQTYQWKDSNGQTVVSDTPPPPSAKGRRAIGAPQPAVVSEKLPEKTPAPNAAPEAKTTAEKDLDFKKRQQENREKAEKQAKEQAAETEKRENCDRARRNLAALEANAPMVTYDDKGERKLLDAGQRDQEMERARRFMAESCK